MWLLTLRYFYFLIEEEHRLLSCVCNKKSARVMYMYVAGENWFRIGGDA